MSPHPEYAALFDALTANNIDFCLLRDELDNGQLLTDLDLLVDEERKEDALDLLNNIGYLVKTTEKLLPHKNVLVRFLDGKFSVIDLHFRVVQNGIELLDCKDVLDRKQRHDNYFLPAKEDFLLLLTLHNVIGKKQIQDKHLSLLQSLAADTQPEGWGQRLREISVAGAAETLMPVLLALRAGQNPNQNIAAIRAQLIALYHAADPGLKHRLRVRDWHHFRRRWAIRPRAPLYALTGVDGVGKTSLNQALLEILNQPGGFPAVTEYMGPWGHYRLRWMRGGLYGPGWSLTTREWLKAMVEPTAGKRPGLLTTLKITARSILGKTLTDAEKLDHASVRTHSRLFLTLRYVRSIAEVFRFMTMLTAEMYYRYYIVYKQRRRGVTAIADRYVYDLMTGRMHEMMPHYYRIRAFFCWLFPKPTRVFLLYNDVETILQRKDDLAEPTLREFIALYEDQAAKRGFEKIKTNKDPHSLACDIIAARFAEIVSLARY